MSLSNTMKLMAKLATGDGSVSVRFGLVQNYDGKSNVKVRIVPEMPEDTQTGWIPLASQFVGNGWGLVYGPSIGDAVIVLFELGSQDSGIVIGLCFNDVDKSPEVPSGEVHLIHKTQSSLKFLNDGSVELITNANLVATVGGDALMSVAGNASAAVAGMAVIRAESIVLDAPEVSTPGNLAVGGAITAASVEAPIIQSGTVLLEEHFHHGGTLPGGVTSPPG